MKRRIQVISLLLLFSFAFYGITTPVVANTAETNEDNKCIYEHDPRLNVNAMEDIVVDPTAIYGFAPDKNSVRLGVYADYDWSDPEVVMNAVKERVEYLSQYDEMYAVWKEMDKAGKSDEEIARKVSAMRNQLRLDSYKDDPVGLEKVKKSNLDTYGNEFGPTPESLFEKYGSWDKVILKSFSSNSGMDACLGLYDIQYEHNLLTGQIKEVTPVIYVVKKGDCLTKIAQKYFGTQNGWKDIYDENKDIINSRYVIYEGEKIIIPLD